MSNKKRITVRDIIRLFPYQTSVEISTGKIILITVEMDEKRNAGKYLSDEILNSEVNTIYLNDFEEDTITIQIAEKDNEENNK